MLLRMLAVPAVVMVAVVAAQAGDLKMCFQYAGDAPVPEPIHVVAAACGGAQLVDQHLLVNPENRGIKNVVVYVYEGRGGPELPPQEPKKHTRELAHRNCQFEPHVLIAQTGDTLKVTNRDAWGHNTHFSFLQNDSRNLVIPAGGRQTVLLQDNEPAPIPVDSQIYPWMRAYVVVLDHPFAGVSDEDGNLVIKDLPEGKELVFRVFHEAATRAFERPVVNGRVEAWERNRFRLTIAAGVNDYGTVTFAADQLK